MEKRLSASSSSFPPSTFLETSHCDLVSVITLFCWERSNGLRGLWALVLRHFLTWVPQPQGKPHLCLGICLVHLSSVTDFCLGTRDQISPGIPLTFLRDYGFNGTVQEYPFFMLIARLFKENGPENSVILYNDTTAISKQGQTLPFDCIEKTNGKWTQV